MSQLFPDLGERRYGWILPGRLLPLNREMLLSNMISVLQTSKINICISYTQ